MEQGQVARPQRDQVSWDDEVSVGLGDPLPAVRDVKLQPIGDAGHGRRPLNAHLVTVHARGRRRLRDRRGLRGTLRQKAGEQCTPHAADGEVRDRPVDAGLRQLHGD